VAVIVLALPVIAGAQYGHPLKGQWSGQWGPANNSTRLLLDLNWDGKTVTGMINPGTTDAVVKSVTIDYTDPSVWVVKIQAEGKDEAGKPVSTASSRTSAPTRGSFTAPGRRAAGRASSPSRETSA
jgi:flagellar hook assembly protein FlgD